MKLYMLITADEYELPIAVRDTVDEIANLIGRNKYDVYSTISRKSASQQTYNGFKYKIIKVDVDEEDDDG